MKKLIIILGVMGVSLSAVFVRISTAPSMVLVFYRVAIASLLLLPPVLLRYREELKKITKKELLLCVVSGAFLGMHFTMYFQSLSYTGIASAVVLVDTEVFFVALAMLVIFHEKISVRGWLGIGLTFLGSVMIALAGGGGGSDVLRGNLMALLGAVCMAVYTMIGKTVRRNMTTTVYTFLVYLSAAVTVLVVLLAGGTPVFGYETVNYASALGMAVFCTLLGHSVFSWGLKYVQASFVANAKLLEPVFATILGMILFGEIPTAVVVAGGVLVLSGVTVYSVAEGYSGKISVRRNRR